MSASCLVQLAALVITFKEPHSHANFSSQATGSQSADLSSFVLQFKTQQVNTRIARVADNGGEMFAVDIRRGYLQIVYNLNGTGNGTLNISSDIVNTNKWFLLNISSETNNTYVRLTKSDRPTSSPCVANFNTSIDFSLLGNGFQNLFKRTGMTIGGETKHESLVPFDGCIGKIELGIHPVVLFNRSPENGNVRDTQFVGYSSGVSDGCCDQEQGQCENENGVYFWDKKQGSCVCKCSKDHQGMFCNSTLKSGDDDEVDKKFVYLVSGVIGGLLLLLVCVVCIFLYCKRTSGGSFGVYNPKSEEQSQGGQQMNTKIQVPVPEKLI